MPGLSVTEELLTVTEAARRLGLSPKSVQTMVSRRDLPAVVFGSRIRIPASAVQVYVDKIERAVALARRLDAELKEDQPPPDDQEARQP